MARVFFTHVLKLKYLVYFSLLKPVGGTIFLLVGTKLLYNYNPTHVLIKNSALIQVNNDTFAMKRTQAKFKLNSMTVA